MFFPFSFSFQKEHDVEYCRDDGCNIQMSLMATVEPQSAILCRLERWRWEILNLDRIKFSHMVSLFFLGFLQEHDMEYCDDCPCQMEMSSTIIIDSETAF